MKYIKDIKKKIEWEEFLNPDCNWHYSGYYKKSRIANMSFINKFHDKIDWEWFFLYQKVPSSLIKKIFNRYPQYFNEEIWDTICMNQKLSEKLIIEIENKGISIFSIICRYPENITRKKFENIIDKLDEKIISNKHIWNNICFLHTLTPKFIEKYQNKVNWDIISDYQKLSERFIEKHQDKVNWVNIFQSQELSEKFMKKWHFKIKK